MNITSSWMQSEWMKALGWTFVHSIWQIAVVGLVLFVILRLIPNRSAHIRYTISTIALWMIVVLALSTFMIMLPQTREITASGGKLVLMQSVETADLSARLSAWLELRIPMMLTIWLGGVAILMLRLGVSVGWMSHLRYDSYPDEQLQSQLDEIIHRVRVNVKATIAESRLIPSPVTIGHLKPMILFPIGLVNQLSIREVEAILTHELAHIVRRDYLSNLIQSFIETLFYYHPVTWWISKVVRMERENRADDLAISWCGDPLGYAKALMTVQEMELKSHPALTIGFLSRKGAMLARIQRILKLPYKNHNQMEKTVLLSLTSLCFLAFTLSSHTEVDTPSDAPDFSHVLLPGVEVVADSIPSKGTYHIHKKTDDQDISVEVEDGNIKELKVDGKEITPAEYGAYDEIISQLFGSINTPLAPLQDLDFVMPAIPAIPGVPMIPDLPEFGFDFDFTTPPLPDMPGMPMMPDDFDFGFDFDFEEMNDGQHFKIFGDGENFKIWNGEGLEGFSFFTDSFLDGSQKFIIIRGGDSTVIQAPHISWSGDAPMIYHRGKLLQEKEWQKHAEEWRENAKHYRDQWREQIDQWRDQQEEWREQSDYRRLELDEMREQLQHRGYADEMRRALEAERDAHDQMKRYEGMAPRLSLSDQMVRDGLIDSGDEVEVQLTPDRLKINGQKMPDNIHQKYLRMYEQQQGIELSGNSKVEFTTKSRQRM